MTDVTVLVGIIAALVTLVVQYLVSPILSTWYQERLLRARAAVERRHDVRAMIEAELEKGFEDLSALRAFLMVAPFPRDPIARGDLAIKFSQLFVTHEQKFGAWRPYLLQEREIEKLCEEYRQQIRDLRIEMIPSEDPVKLQGKVAITEMDMSKKASEIIAGIDKLRW